MTLRVRLALWYGALCGLILLLVIALTYALHVRGHYDDLDRALIISAGHAAESALLTDDTHSGMESGAMALILRRYDENGVTLEQHATPAHPVVEPRAILAAPAGPAYDVLAGLAPPLITAPLPAEGAFGLLAFHDQRWRVYVRPVAPGMPDGFIVALAPLGQLDAAIATFRAALLLIALGGLAVALSGGWVIAGQALRPITQLAGAAQAIAVGRDFTHRVATPPHHDEVGRLAAIFNTMLTSLEDAYRAQQRFVADASHELRAPLTAIQGNLELLRRRSDLPPAAYAEALAEAGREATRLTHLVADLLALARADAGVTIQPRLVDLDAVVLDTFHTARSLAHGQTLTLDPFEPIQVWGDPDKLKQLVLILLDNALKYTLPTGQVRLGLCHEGTHATVSVCDTGVGISEADLPHVFERFYRADPARSRDPGGTGLGLPIAHWIAEQHSGSITIESRPGQGTTAWVRLPLIP